MGRYCRDEIILQGLDIAHCPTVTETDAPGGLVQPNAMSIKWLQNALDMFHRKYPFSADIQEISMTALAGQEDLVVTNDTSLFKPRDYIIDIKDGVTGLRPNSTHPFQLKRRDYTRFRVEKLNNLSNTTATIPSYYCKINNRIKITPKIVNTLTLNLEYYALPGLLEPSDEVPFPDEWTLIEFIHLKAKEWTRALDPGTAQFYLQKQLAGFRSSGLLDEPEHEEAVPLESYSSQYTGRYNRNAWMGNPNG